MRHTQSRTVTCSIEKLYSKVNFITLWLTKLFFFLFTFGKHDTLNIKNNFVYLKTSTLTFTLLLKIINTI